MFEIVAQDLRPGDVYTDDRGQSWWRVIDVDNDTTPRCVRVYAESAGGGDHCSSVYDIDHVLVIA